jgi:hypothetical protein
MKEILSVMDKTVLQRALQFPGVIDFIKTAPDSELKECVLSQR